ncbi:CRISPR-associated protein, Csy1 family [Thiocapsa sp. KS1]|nr:type I-F CRISPR-associated protein Csy1 [Thiocapsa sp. KS1]CRI66738.1 CRISPR-associated protein, Csy1 family [Thiocapsa sp. KS1]
MSTPLTGRPAELRSLIADFLFERLNAKLEKLAEDDPKRVSLREQFVPSAWIEDAARRVGQIQAVTHSLKPIHPDAKGSSLFLEPGSLASLVEVGSHSLGIVFDTDVVGNAAALDVYKFLKLRHEGQSLLTLAIAADADFGAALTDDPITAQAWMAAFAGLAKPRGKLSSHAQAKQIYWPVGSDPHDDGDYHLLAPLYPTSLVHRVYQAVQEDRFSEDAKVARKARKAGEWHERPVHEYSNLAVQKLGGTQPQNISQLNSERRGDNCLLASLPPVWQSLTVKPLFGVKSLFNVYHRRREVRTHARELRRFLESNPASNLKTRQRLDELVNALLDELIQFTAEVRTLDAGWSRDPQCDQLPPAHSAWLDPDAANVHPDDVIERVASDFAHWLNAQLRDPLPMGDPEYLYWCKLAREQIKEYEGEISHEQ